MNCREWEERVALYAGGDLDDPAVATHLAECAGCQVFLSGLRQTLELLREEHAEEIPPARYTAVRARVMAELERSRRSWGWAWAAAGLAAIVVALWFPREMRVEEMPQVAVARPRPPAEWDRTSAAPRRMPARKPALQAESLLHKKAEQILVKIEAADPDVVIYWIAETKGDELK